MSKTSIISSYISKCNKIIENKNINEAKLLISEIVAVYNKEIPNITDNLESYWYETNPNYIKDITLIKAQLSNYKSNIKTFGRNIENTSTILNINNNSSSNSLTKVENNIAITLEQTIEVINKIPKSILSDEEKEELEDKLAGLQSAIESKDKDKIGKKIINVVKYAIEKGPTVYVAISSFINFIIQKVVPMFLK